MNKKIQTTDGVKLVTDHQGEWLEAIGYVRIMANYPQAMAVYDGTAFELEKLLQEMPAGWAGSSQAAPTDPPVDPAGDPEDPVGTAIVGTEEQTDEGNEIVALLRSIDASLKIIAASANKGASVTFKMFPDQN